MRVSLYWIFPGKTIFRGDNARSKNCLSSDIQWHIFILNSIIRNLLKSHGTLIGHVWGIFQWRLWTIMDERWTSNFHRLHLNISQWISIRTYFLLKNIETRIVRTSNDSSKINSRICFATFSFWRLTHLLWMPVAMLGKFLSFFFITRKGATALSLWWRRSYSAYFII